MTCRAADTDDDLQSKYTRTESSNRKPSASTGIDTLSELGENEARVLRALQESGGKATQALLAQKTGLADSAVARAIINLSSKGLIKELVEKPTEIQATKEGE